MYRLIFVLSLFLFSAPQWYHNLDEAKDLARRQHRRILLNFSGSDWCQPCIRLEKDIFGSQAFIKLADTALVLVNADFPRMKKNRLPADQKRINEAMAEQYNAAGKFPLTVLMDADGNVLKEWDGYPNERPEQFCAEVVAAAR